MNSNLLIEKIEIVQSLLLVNEFIEYDEWKKENNLRFSVIPEVGLNKKDKSSARLKLEIELFDFDFVENDEPFYIKVKMYAYFNENIVDDDDDKNVTQKFAVNMVSMAYPYLRAHVAAITSLAGIPDVIVPAINVYKLFEEIEEKQKKKNKENKNVEIETDLD